jgi:hypothetical protein
MNDARLEAQLLAAFNRQDLEPLQPGTDYQNWLQRWREFRDDGFAAAAQKLQERATPINGAKYPSVEPNKSGVPKDATEVEGAGAGIVRTPGAEETTISADVVKFEPAISLTYSIIPSR